MANIATSFYEGTAANERFLVPNTVSVIVDGSGGDDYIEATADRDTLYGGTGNDAIAGSGGNDTIYGDDFPDLAGGADQILAGSGDDIAFGCGGRDYINGEAGDDLLFGDRQGDFLVGGSGWDVIRGGYGRDVMFGNGIIPGEALPILLELKVNTDGITGAGIPVQTFGGDLGPMPIGDDKATDFLYGGWSKDIAFGQGGDDYLYGGQGGDVLAGGHGRDCLNGGGGKDQFLFAEYGAKNTDCITDFEARDRIALDASVFRKLGSGDVLKSKYFHVGDAPLTGHDRIVYDKATGRIFYDRDGSGGKFDMRKFAMVDKGTELHAHDFLLLHA